jgi:Fe-S cluster assembly ATP-binding protein
MTKIPILKIKDLHVSVEGKEILKGVNLTINASEVHALMGRNGSGKSTLSYTLMGHPRYKVTAGSVEYKGQDLLAMSTDERARAGLYLAFQYPVSIPEFQFPIFCVLR